MGLGSFSSLDPGPAPVWRLPCTVCVCWVRSVTIISQVGQPAGVWKSHSGLEHSRGGGAGMVGLTRMSFCCYCLLYWKTKLKGDSLHLEDIERFNLNASETID